MKALTVVPGQSGSARLDEIGEPSEDAGSILVESVAVGTAGRTRRLSTGHTAERRPATTGWPGVMAPPGATAMAEPRGRYGLPPGRKRLPHPSRVGRTATAPDHDHIVAVAAASGSARSGSDRASRPAAAQVARDPSIERIERWWKLAATPTGGAPWPWAGRRRCCWVGVDGAQAGADARLRQADAVFEELGIEELLSVAAAVPGLAVILRRARRGRA